MEIKLIDKKYCSDEGIHILFPTLQCQTIFSRSGILYFLQDGLKINKHLLGEIHNILPYKRFISSRNEFFQLIEYNTFYIRYYNSEDSNKSSKDKFLIAFLYATKIDNATSLLYEFSLADFKKEEKIISKLDKSEIKRFLTKNSSSSGQYIFDMSSGIKYVKVSREMLSIDNIFDLSDSSIIKLYNKSLSDQKDNISCFNTVIQVQNIEDVKKFNLTGLQPLLKVVIGPKCIYVYEFELIYCDTNCYELIYSKIIISNSTLKNIIRAS